MNTTSVTRPDWGIAFRFLGRAAAAVVFAAWVALVLWEPLPLAGVPLSLVTQAALLALIFGGYALSVRHELGGALVSLAGVAAFFAATYLQLEVQAGLAFALFGLPPVLFLTSWQLVRHGSHRPTPPPAATE